MTVFTSKRRGIYPSVDGKPNNVKSFNQSSVSNCRHLQLVVFLSVKYCVTLIFKMQQFLALFENVFGFFAV